MLAAGITWRRREACISNGGGRLYAVEYHVARLRIELLKGC